MRCGYTHTLSEGSVHAALPSPSHMLQEISVSHLLFLSTTGAEGQEKGAALSV